MHLLSKKSQIIMVYHNYFIDLLQLWPYDVSFLFTLPDDELLPTLAQDIVLIIYVWHRCGMQFERLYKLNDSVVGSFPHFNYLGFQQTLPNLGNSCGDNSVIVLPYAHPQLFKVFKHLIYIWHRCGMQFERFYSLNDSVVGSFPHLHYFGFQQTLPNLGKPLWW
jgi:hypothetical protein